MNGRGYAFWFLLKRYAEGRKLCNCQEAYYDEKGSCSGGCSANQIDAKYMIAKKALNEIRNLQRKVNKPKKKLGNKKE